jgi:hypothetical protein
MRKSTMTTMIRQGDVLVMRATMGKITKAHVEEPRAADGSVVLAHGEVTGHRHRLTDPGVCLLRAEGVSDRMMTASAVSTLRHEEHDAIEIGAGTYVVRIQREYDEMAHSRQVED